MNATDDYEFFGLAASLSPEQAKTAAKPIFRRLSKQYHPNVVGDSETNNRRFQKIVEAHDRIQNLSARRINRSPQRGGGPTLSESEFGRIGSNGSHIQYSFTAAWGTFAFLDMLNIQGDYQRFLKWIFAAHAEMGQWTSTRTAADGSLMAFIAEFKRHDPVMKNTVIGMAALSIVIDSFFLAHPESLSAGTLTLAMWPNILSLLPGYFTYQRAQFHRDTGVREVLNQTLKIISNSMSRNAAPSIPSALFEYDVLCFWSKCDESQNRRPELTLRRLKTFFVEFPFARWGLLLRSVQQRSMPDSLRRVLKRDFYLYPSYWREALGQFDWKNSTLPAEAQQSLDDLQRDLDVYLQSSWRAPGAQVGQLKDLFCEVLLTP